MGLFGWLWICRHWPLIADYLAIPGPREMLTGPNAALAGLVFAGAPMVLWSLLVDKDRNPRWQPSSLDEVTPAQIEDHLRPRFAGVHPLGDLR